MYGFRAEQSHSEAPMPRGLFTLKQQLQGVIQKAWNTTINPLKTPAVDYLVVAGGGGGGEGGGGGGGLLQGSTPVTAGSSITVTVGAAGSGPGYTNGGNSLFGSISATGGGLGYGADGGSGGGARYFVNYVNGQGVAGQGNAGGLGVGDPGSGTTWGGGGGGGAGTVGLKAPASGYPGNGGAGIGSAISGTVTTYAGGGGGGGYLLGGDGGVGGGGAGSSGSHNAAVAGTVNTGGGGGGGYYSAQASGGSGIVIVSYPDIYAGAASTTGSPTVSTSGAGSTYFSGTANQYLSATDSDLNLGTGDFTIEMWVYITNLGSLRLWFSGGNNIYIGWEPTTNYLYYSNATGASFQLLSNSSALVNNVWTHIVVVRSSGVTSLFANGTRYATSSSSGTQAVDCTNFVWGAYNQAPELYNPNGYFTNLRMTNTAVYNPSSTTLTVPTTPLTPISGTKILLNSNSGSYLADSSTSNVVFSQGNVSAAVPVWNQLSPFATGLGYKNRVYTYTGSGTITF